MESTRPPVWKKVDSSRQIRRQLSAYPVHVDESAELVLFVELHLHERRMHARSWWCRWPTGRHSRRCSRRSSAGLRARSTWRISSSTSRDVVVCQLQAGAAGRFYVDHELSGIRAREERHAQAMAISARLSTEAGHDDRRPSPWDAAAPCSIDRVILGQHVIVAAIERRQHALQPTAFVLAPQLRCHAPT